MEQLNGHDVTVVNSGDAQVGITTNGKNGTVEISTVDGTRRGATNVGDDGGREAERTKVRTPKANVADDVEHDYDAEGNRMRAP